MSDFYAPSFTNEERDLREKNNDFTDVSDEIELIKFAIREKVIARRKYIQNETNAMQQQVFNFGGSIEIISLGDNVVKTIDGLKIEGKKNVALRHDYGLKSLRTLFLIYKDLMFIQLEYLKLKGKNSEETDQSLRKLVDSISSLPERMDGLQDINKIEASLNVDN